MNTRLAAFLVVPFLVGACASLPASPSPSASPATAASEAPASAQATSTPDPTPAVDASCEPSNRGARMELVTLKYVPAFTGGPPGWYGIVASGQVVSEACVDLVLEPAEFALSSPTGVIKCGDSRASIIE